MLRAFKHNSRIFLKFCSFSFISARTFSGEEFMDHSSFLAFCQYCLNEPLAHIPAKARFSSTDVI
jgi:hypothetical protein